MLVLLGGLTATAPMALDLYLPGFPAIAETFGTDTGSVQLSFSACLIGLALGQVLWGPTSDRFGRKRPMMIGMAIFVLASLLIAVAPTFGIMVVLRFLQALGGSAGIVAARAVVRDLYSGADLARTMSAIVTVFAIAPVVAPIIGSAIIAVAPWQAMFVFLAGFGLVCLAGIARLPETLPPERRTDHNLFGAMRQYGTILADPRFGYSASVAALGSTALFAYISSSPGVIIDFYGVSASGFALIFAGLSTGFAVGAQVNMRMIRKFPVRTLLGRAVLVQFTASIALLVAVLVGVPLWLFIVPLLITVMTVSAVNGNGVALSLDPFPRAAASAAALVGGAQMAMGALSSAAMSALQLPDPIEMGLAMSLAGTLAATIVVVHALRARRVPA